MDSFRKEVTWKLFVLCSGMEKKSPGVRNEKSKQFSGPVQLNNIPVLKRRHYHIVQIPLEGDQPKEYIKAYFYEHRCRQAGKPGSWPGFFAKFGGKSYPHESIIEYIINQIGICLGLNMNEVRLVQVSDQVRFLSKDFLQKGQKLVHGIEILAEYFEDRQFVETINADRRTRREYLTFKEIENAIYHVYPVEAPNIMIELVKLITFDAIVGNNDRHFHNWGVLDFVEKAAGQKVKFSPVYDTARAFFWNKKTPAVKEIYRKYGQGDNQILAFIKKTKPRFSPPDNAKADHFQLLGYVARYKEAYKDVINDLLQDKQEQTALETLRVESQALFCSERCSLMEEILKLRFYHCRQAIQL